MQSCTLISKLHTTNDGLLFCKATLSKWLSIQCLLNIYEAALGQHLNRHKSSIFFSTNTTREIRSQLINLSGVSVCRNHDKCLGLPTFVGKSNHGTFENIRDRVRERINSWKNVYLSQAGKEVLLKLVI